MSKKIFSAIPIHNPEQIQNFGAKSELRKAFRLTERETYRKHMPFTKNNILFVETTLITFSRNTKETGNPVSTGKNK